MIKLDNLIWWCITVMVSCVLEPLPDELTKHIGGGFAMGSPYFYLEPLLVMLTLLKSHYRNPAIFALEYDLVPESTWPTQAHQTSSGYEYVLSLVTGDASRVCIAGDSAGTTLLLSLLLTLAKDDIKKNTKPAYATLLSPWVTLVSDDDHDTASDFISAGSLHLYASEYAKSEENLHNPIISPGCCTDRAWWTAAAPKNGFYLMYGSEEVLAPNVRRFVRLLKSANVDVSVREEQNEIHAWVIARLFLADSLEERTSGMKAMVKAIASNIKPQT